MPSFLIQLRSDEDKDIGNFDSGLPYYRILSKHDGEKIVIVFHLYTRLINYDTSHMSEWIFFNTFSKNYIFWRIMVINLSKEIYSYAFISFLLFW